MLQRNPRLFSGHGGSTTLAYGSATSWFLVVIGAKRRHWGKTHELEKEDGRSGLWKPYVCSL